MIHKGCKYYPCHEGIEDCSYCYCLKYPCMEMLCKDTGGFWVKDKEGRKVWDCSECVWPHKFENLEELRRINV